MSEERKYPPLLWMRLRMWPLKARIWRILINLLVNLISHPAKKLRREYLSQTTSGGVQARS
jgi:hypothetical protein